MYREAVDVITTLHSMYDQGGNAHRWHKFYYHNAYLIVDRKESWIVETCTFFLLLFDLCSGTRVGS